MAMADWLPRLNLTTVEMGLILVEGSILITFLITLVLIRKRMSPFSHRRISGPLPLKTRLPDGDRLHRLVREAETISATLSRNLEEKKERAGQLIAALEEKIQRLERMAQKFSPAPCGPALASGDGREEIMKMSLAGHGTAEIAARLGLSRQEVQLILDLGKIGTS